MADKKHSTVGASSATRWWNCPGSVALSSNIAKQPPSPYAEEGTAAHELAERCLKERKDPFQLVGEFAENGWEFTEEMAEHVITYLEAINSDLNKYNLTWDNVEVERHFTLSHIDKEAFGTNDANLGIFLRRLIVYDFKYGSGVPVEFTTAIHTIWGYIQSFSFIVPISTLLWCLGITLAFEFGVFTFQAFNWLLKKLPNMN